MDDKFWRITYQDIQMKMKVYIGNQQSLIAQDFQNLMKMLEMAFPSDNANSGIPKGTKLIQTEEDMMLAMSRVFH